MGIKWESLLCDMTSQGTHSGNRYTMEGSTLYTSNNHEGRGRDNIIDTIVRPNPRMYYYAYSTPQAFRAYLFQSHHKLLLRPGALVSRRMRWSHREHTPLTTRYLSSYFTKYKPSFSLRSASGAPCHPGETVIS